MAITVALADLDTWLNEQAENTIDTAYDLSVTDVNSSDAMTSLKTALKNNLTKYVDLTNTIITGITSIGQSLFEGCINLTGITIPDSVTSISNNVFKNCSSLKKIIIPVNVTSLGPYCFYNCILLENVNILGSISSIPNECFQNCSSLTNINIPDSVTSIGGSVFEGCSSLESITIPDSVTSIGGQFCNNCTSLKTVTFLSQSLKEIPIYGFNGCKSLISVNIPDSVTEIGSRAFQSCSSLKSINIPDSVTSIGGETFLGCSSLESIVLSNSLTTIKYSTFMGCDSLESIIIPDSVTTIERYAFVGCDSLKSIHLSNKLTSIGIKLFTNCNNLISINIPSGLTDISDMLSGISSLKEISLWDISNIESYSNAFKGCTSIETINTSDIYQQYKLIKFLKEIQNESSDNFPDNLSVDSIVKSLNGDKVKFEDLNDLLQLVSNNINNPIKLNVIDIPSDAYGVDGKFGTVLKNNSEVAIDLRDTYIVYDSTVTYDATFSECQNLIYPPEFSSGFTSLNNLFIMCTLLQEGINCPDTLKSAHYMYCGCTYLKTVPNFYSSEACYGVFAGCQSLESIYNFNALILNDSSNQIFYNCSNLTDIYCSSAYLASKNANIISNNEYKSVIKFHAKSNVTEVTEIPTGCSYNSETNTVTVPQSQIKNFVDYDFTTRAIELSSNEPSWNITSLEESIYKVINKDDYIDGYWISDADNTFVGYSLKSMDYTPTDLTGVTSIDFKDDTLVTKFPTIPETVTSLESAFEGCTNLTEIANVPASIVNLNRAFYGCTSLEKINNWKAEVSNFEETPSDVFTDCPSTLVINVNQEKPDSTVEEISNNNDNWYLIHLHKENDTQLTYKYYSQDGYTSKEGIIALKDYLGFKAYGFIDEIYFDTNTITDEIIQKMIKYKYPFGFSNEILDPSKSSFVLWASDPDNVHTNILDKDLVPIMKKLYPVGSIKISENNVNPETYITGTKWKLKSTGRVLQGNDGTKEDGTEIEAGIPNIVGSYTDNAGANPGTHTNAFDTSASYVGAGFLGSVHTTQIPTINFEAAKGEMKIDGTIQNDVYGKSDTVQPPAYLVYIWKRYE